MRLNLTLSPSTQPVPYDHLHRLTGALHKWIGPDNDLHDGLSLYSFGWLDGGSGTREGLTFADGARWRVSFYQPEAAKACLDGILRDPEVLCGMRVEEAKEQRVPSFSQAHTFKVDSPVLARVRRDDGSRAHLTWDDPEADAALTRTLRTKLQAAGVSDASPDAESNAVRVAFDRSYAHPKTKLARIKDTRHRANMCPVTVEGPPEAIRFAWLVGVGDLTGSGFGALR